VLASKSNRPAANKFLVDRLEQADLLRVFMMSAASRFHG
jgi:hypothetical protein